MSKFQVYLEKIKEEPINEMKFLKDELIHGVKFQFSTTNADEFKYGMEKLGYYEPDDYEYSAEDAWIATELMSDQKVLDLIKKLNMSYDRDTK